MKYKFAFVTAGALLLTAPALAQDAKAVIARAQAAMGNPAAPQYIGSGMNAFFGQALTAGQEWPRRPLESMTAAVNYDQKAATLGLVFKNPVFGGQRQNTFVSGEKAWNIGPNGPNPQLAAAEERQLQIWMTPHGFLRAAAAGNPTVTSRTEGSAKIDVVSFTAMNKFKVMGTIDAQGLVTGVETVFPNPVMGDMPYAFKYTDYKDFGGVKFPRHIVQSGGGFAVNDFTVTGVQTTVTADLKVPANVQSAVLPPVQVVSSKLADGVWLLAEGVSPQRAGGLRCLRRCDRSPANRGPLPRGDRRSEEVDSRQADQISRQYASPLRPLGRLAHLCRRRRDGGNACLQ